MHRQTNLPHGRGIMVIINGDIYEGHFKDGVPHGKCRWITKYCCKQGMFNCFYPSTNQIYTVRFPNKEYVFQGNCFKLYWLKGTMN
jgi:hypothetical protein